MDSHKLLEAKYRQIADAYLQSLQTADLEGVLSLFDPQGIVISPLYGQRPAPEFYRLLFRDTQHSETQVLDIMTNTQNKCLMVYFNYRWTLLKGEIASFDCVDLFRLNHDHKIESLRIIYDTFPIRPLISY